jgi:hypothetical protein
MIGTKREFHCRFVDSCVNEQKKKRGGLPGELERRKERICDDAYCAAEKDGDV